MRHSLLRSCTVPKTVKMSMYVMMSSKNTPCTAVIPWPSLVAPPATISYAKNRSVILQNCSKIQNKFPEILEKFPRKFSHSEGVVARISPAAPIAPAHWNTM